MEPPIAVPGGPPPKRRDLILALAARSPAADRLGKEAPQPVATGKASAFRTVGFSGRLRERPAGKPTGYGMGWEPHGISWFIPPLPDELQNSWISLFPERWRTCWQPPPADWHQPGHFRPLTPEHSLQYRRSCIPKAECVGERVEQAQDGVNTRTCIIGLGHAREMQVRGRRMSTGHAHAHARRMCVHGG